MTSPKIDEEALEAAARDAHKHMGAESPWPIFSQMFPEDARRIKAMLSSAISAYLSRRAEQGFREMPRIATQKMREEIAPRPPHWPPEGSDALRDAAVLSDQAAFANHWMRAFDQHAKDSQNDGR